MRYPRRLPGAAACLALGLAACGPAQPVVGPPPVESDLLQTVGPGDPCGAGRLQGLVGQDASNANVAALPGGSRILYPDMTSGPAFKADRITIRVDAGNRITAVGCG